MTLTRLPALLGLCACVLAAAVPASAQTVYRCGADGRSYSQTPCAGGRVVDVDDARTPEQQQQAQTAADRDARLGAALERDRRMEEALATQRSSTAGALGPSREGDPQGVTRTLEVVPHYSNKRPRSNIGSTPRFEAPAALLPPVAPPVRPAPKSATGTAVTTTVAPRAAAKPQAKPAKAAAD